MRRILFAVTGICLIAGLATTGAWLWLKTGFERPGPLTAETKVIIRNGAGIATIADDLARSGIVADALVFRLGVRFLAAEKPLRAGEFAFPAGVSAAAAVDILQSGRTVVRRLTVAEGLTTPEIISLLNRTEGLTGLVVSTPPEGSLLPETYHFSFGDERREIVRRMGAAMEKTLADLWFDRIPDLPLSSPAEALILASIVEKETGRADERARVAAVFLNRLKIGMRLQSDPTVVYGLTEGNGDLGRALTKNDLKNPSAYNTYVIDGLPPTPIANPGRATIAAVLRPVESGDLYFVADGSGGHLFAETLAQHNRNVAKWRRIQKHRANPASREN